MGIPREHILPSRVLHQDDDFITVEVAKHDGVEFHLQQNEEGETVGGDEFLMLVFVHVPDGHEGEPVMETWKPWET